MYIKEVSCKSRYFEVEKNKGRATAIEFTLHQPLSIRFRGHQQLSRLIQKIITNQILISPLSKSKGLIMRPCRLSAFASSLLLLGCLSGAVIAADVDVPAAEGLAKKSGCLKCHSVAQKKDGPSYKSVAEKYKGKADAEATLFKHLTTNPKVKVDGKEEEHDSLKTKNEADIRNVVKWILSR
jgi:cytochrome c